MTDLTLLSKGKRHPVRIEKCTKTGNLLFRKAAFALKNEIKAMKGARWNPDRKHWSVADHPRNHFQLQAMMVEPTNPNPYDWFERDLEDIGEVCRPLQGHQIEMVRKQLTYRYQIHAADMGLGKTLTAIEIIERLAELYNWSKEDIETNVWFVGPKSALESVEADTYKWDGPDVTLKTYERFVIDHEKSLAIPPQCLFFDECSGLKNPTALRSRAAQRMADAIRAIHGTSGSVALLSGSPTAKTPADIWSQAEICWPGFLREGSLKAFKDRYAIVEQGEDADGNKFSTVVGWKEDEVERIPTRLAGLMSVYRKSDLLDLPDRVFQTRETEVTPRIKRVAKALLASAPNVITGLTWLRALSSGFQYDQAGDTGANGERAMVEAPCPKDEVLRGIMQEENNRGRMITFASFQGSLDRVKRIAQSEGWDTIMVDGRGWNCFDKDNNRVKQHILEYWANNPNKTLFIGNPASCRFGLTLVEAKTVVVFDQNFSAECRLQSLDRNYRIGQEDPCRVIDLIHLPVDRLILDTLTENKKLEELSLGILMESLE
jgi:SNF2 family DNA or RNA helicase